MPSAELQSALDDIHTSGAAIYIIGQQHGETGYRQRVKIFRDEVARVFADADLRKEWKDEYVKSHNGDPDEYLDLDVLLLPGILRLANKNLQISDVTRKVKYWADICSTLYTMSEDRDTDVPIRWDPDDPIQARSRFAHKFNGISAARRKAYWEECAGENVLTSGGIMGDLTSLSDGDYVQRINFKVARDGIEKVTRVSDLMCLTAIPDEDKERLKRVYMLLAQNVGSGPDGFVPLEWTTRTSVRYNGVPHLFLILPEGEISWERIMPGSVSITLPVLNELREEARKAARRTLAEERATRRPSKRTQSRRERRRKLKGLKKGAEVENLYPECHDQVKFDVRECSVCSEEILQDDEKETKDSCKHMYHTVCLQQWYATCRKRGVPIIQCPYCGI